MKGFSCLPDFHTFYVSNSKFSLPMYNYNIDALIVIGCVMNKGAFFTKECHIRVFHYSELSCRSSMFVKPGLKALLAQSEGRSVKEKTPDRAVRFSSLSFPPSHLQFVL